MKNRLKVLRAERDWTQGELATQLGVSRQAVNAVETGKYDPSLPLAFKIAKLFGVRIDEVFSVRRRRRRGRPLKKTQCWRVGVGWCKLRAMLFSFVEKDRTRP